MNKRGITLKIIISNQSELPIYAQIKEQIKEQILNGQIPEGTLLPSIRKLAKELSVSVITTTRAYSDLEAEGFIASSQGRGSIVLSQDNELLREQYLKRIEEGLGTAISTAHTIGLSREEFSAMVDALWEDEAD
jgi:GntR family transcriptional regulator